MSNKCNKITLVCNKGGVGRSTTTISVGWRLADLGHNVLLVDLDSQSNTSMTVAKDFQGSVLQQNGNRNISALIQDERGIVDDYVVDTRHPKLKLLASELSLDITEEKIRTLPTPTHVLVNKLEGVDEQYDFVIFDTPPRKTDKLMHNALMVSDWYWYIIGAEDMWSLDARVAMDSVIRDVRKLNKELKPLPVLLTRYKANQTLSNSISAAIDEIFVAQGKFQGNIRNTTYIPRSIQKRQSIYEFKKSNPQAKSVCDDYSNITKELVEFLK